MSSTRWGLDRTVLAAMALACVLLGASPVVAQHGTGRVQGEVTDPEGNPVEGVAVTAFNAEMTPSRLTATTDADGDWTILGISSGDWKFTFEKDGYLLHEIDASVAAMDRNPDMDVTLTPVAPAPEEGDEAAVAGGVASREAFEEGNALFDQGDYEGAIARWEAFLEANPDVVEVHFNIGNAHRRLDEIEEARTAYEKVLEANPSDTRANYALGEMLVDDGQIEAAQPYLDKALEGDPDDAAVYYNVAELHFSQGAVEEAIVNYERAVQIDPTYLPAWKQLGFAHARAGNNEQAIGAFREFIELAPEDDPDLALVRDILAALGGGD